MITHWIKQETISPWMNKLNVSWWMGHVHSFKVAPLKILINYEAGKSNFSVEQPGRHHVQQVIQVKIIGNKTYQTCVPPDKKQWEEHGTTSATTLTNMKRHQANPSGRAFCKMNGLQSSKMPRSWKPRKVWETFSGRERLRRYDN